MFRAKRQHVFSVSSGPIPDYKHTYGKIISIHKGKIAIIHSSPSFQMLCPTFFRELIKSCRSESLSASLQDSIGLRFSERHLLQRKEHYNATTSSSDKPVH